MPDIIDTHFERFSCVYVDPADRTIAAIDLSIEHSYTADSDARWDFSPSTAVVDILGMCLWFGTPDPNEAARQGYDDGEWHRIDHTALEKMRPCFLIHNDIIVLSQCGLPDLPPEQHAVVELCCDHKITLRNRALILGADRDRHGKIETLRSLHRSLYECELRWFCSTSVQPNRIRFGETGYLDLIPMGNHDLSPHVLHSSSFDEPAPDLDSILKKGKS